jgi:hypothetical protein
MTDHQFTIGQQVICIRAPEAGIPIEEGKTYTVTSLFQGNQSSSEACIPGMERIAGITLKEKAGWFTADRFTVIGDTP